MKSMETGRQDGGSDKNHAPFSVGKTGNISRKFLTIILKIFDKNFERLQTHTNLGIYAVQKRLEYVYHGKAKMTITSEQEKGTLVVLEIPLKKAKEIMENGTSGNDIG